MSITSTVMSSAMSCSQRSSSSLSSRRISSSKRSIVSLKNRNHASSKSSYSRKETVVVLASSAKIKVVGCGGGGGNAVNRMIEAGVSVRLLFFKALSTKINDDDSESRWIMKISLVRFTRTKVSSSRIQFSIDLLNRQFCIAKCWDSAYRRDLMRETERTKILFFLLNLNPARPGRNSRKHTTHHYSTVPSLLLPSN